MKLGVLGRALAHTLSPQIHARILEYTGMRGEYRVYEKTPEELPVFIRSLIPSGFTGINVTIPYKTEVMPHLSSLSREAREIGAVNTIHILNGELIGYNTDYFGFGCMLLKAGIGVKGKRACVLGAGGAARAASVYLRDAGAEVSVISRDPERASAAFAGFAVKGYGEIEGELLVNTTPVGMFPDTESYPVGAETLAGFDAVADIVYNPRETALVKLAKRAGCAVADGLYMLIAQAVKAEEIWQGRTIPKEIIDKIAEEL